MPFYARRMPLYASVALLLAATLFHGCKKPQAGAAYTLNAPVDLEGVGICFYEDNGVLIADDPNEGRCTHPAELVPDEDNHTWDAHMYLAAISNYGENALQIYSLDTRSTLWLTALRSPESAQCLAREIAVRQPIQQNGQWILEAPYDDPCSSIIGQGIRSFDNLPGTPGNNGIRLDGQIEKNTAAHFAGIQWVATSGPNTLTAVNLLSGKRVPTLQGAEQQFIDYPISDLASVHEGGWLIASNPRDRELIAYQPTFHCNGQNERHELDCNLTVDLGDPLHIALEGSPRHIATSPQGDVYVSAESVPYLTRISLNDDECPAHSPCKIPITYTCNDGIDNDGNGLIDAEDPSCYGPWMNEGETFVDADCADGIDNDGDGHIDALDPKCTWRNYGDEDGSDNSCSDGIDNDGDGLIDAEDPKCANGSEFPPDAGFTPPEEAELPRYTPSPVYPGPIAVSPDGDIVMVAENGGTRVEEGGLTDLVFICGRPLDDDARYDEHACTTPNSLLQLNEGDPARNQGVGLQFPAGIQSIAISNRIERLPVQNGSKISSNDDHDPNVVLLTTRIAYVAATDGRIYLIDIDEMHDFVDNQGDFQQKYTPLFQFNDRNNAYADIRNMRLRHAERLPILPEDAQLAPAPSPGTQPALVAIDPAELRFESPSGTTFLGREHLITPEAFIRLPREERFCFATGGLGCLTHPPRDKQFYPYSFERQRTSLKHDARVFDENWTLAWEGSLPIDRPNNARNDAVVLDDDGWIHFLGKDSCDIVNNDSQRLCDMNLGWSICPEVQDFCERGVDLCAENVNICDLCPRACASEVDLCAAGVQPGDIAIIPPMEPTSYCLRHEDNCNSQRSIPEQCLPGYGDPREPGAFDSAISGQVTTGNEYRVVEVRGNSIRVAPLDFTDRTRYRLPRTLPSTACYRKPFTVEVIAADRWTLQGSRLVGVDTPYVNVNNACVYEVDTNDDLRNWRPNDGELVVTRYGFEFHISEGDYLHYCRTQADHPEECAHALRGYQITFASEDNLTPRNLVDVVGTMGIAARRVTNLNELRNQILFIDAGYNRLAVIQDDSNVRATVVP